jgi:aspartate kinase
MKVFKFGGASVNSAGAVRNVATILRNFESEHLALVFSAMGKTTNAMERFVEAAFAQLPETQSRLAGVLDYHMEIATGLFDNISHPVFEQIKRIFENISTSAALVDCTFDEFYDRIVPMGEMLSTTIIANYLNSRGTNVCVIPAGEIIITSNRFRDAAPQWEKTAALIREKAGEVFDKKGCMAMITQGFIGASVDGRSTTLGREGSDFTASILAYCLDADEVIVWKDVDGLLNADPACFSNTISIDHISYHEAIELSFFGAKILHPKTIKPLQNKAIPLRIKSFYYPELPGTLIDSEKTADSKVPFLIKKSDQMVISFVSKDFSFVAEDRLHRLFGVFNQMNIKINLMQNSAISFTIITNHLKEKLNMLTGALNDEFDIRYNEGIELLTIRNFNDAIVAEMLTGRTVLLEQRSRKTLQVAYFSGF